LTKRKSKHKLSGYLEIILCQNVLKTKQKSEFKNWNNFNLNGPLNFDGGVIAFKLSKI